jgi:hypothetical protein
MVGDAGVAEYPQQLLRLLRNPTVPRLDGESRHA